MIFGESPRAAHTVSAPASPARRSFLALLAYFVFVSALFTLVGCGGGGDGGTTGTNTGVTGTSTTGGGSISGRVLDRNGGDNPVAGATVSYRGVVATTDSTGNFTLATTSGSSTDKVTVVGPTVTSASGIVRAGYYGTVVYLQQSYGSDGFAIASGTTQLGDLLIYNTDGPPPPPRF